MRKLIFYSSIKSLLQLTIIIVFQYCQIACLFRNVQKSNLTSMSNNHHECVHEKYYMPIYSP